MLAKTTRLLMLIGVAQCAYVLAVGFYPEVRPLQKSFDIPDVLKADVSSVIRSPKGVPLYHLQCHSAEWVDPDFNYSGDFECRLSSVGDNDTFSTLLTEDMHQSKDWESRARFFSADLRPPCGQIVDFGAVRTFELREMKLTLEIVDPRFDRQGNLSALRLNVSVGLDPSAQRDIAEIVPLPRNAPAQCQIDRYFPDPERFQK